MALTLPNRIMTTMPIAMTPEQEKDFEEKGFIILEDFLQQDELAGLLDAVEEVGDKIRASRGMTPDEPFAVRNALAHHEAFLNLIDHPRMLPLVVDAIGWNIQIRTSHLDYRPPYPKEKVAAENISSNDGPNHNAGYRNTGWHPDLAGEGILEAPSLDGRLPFMEVKVFYTLSDQRASNSGNLWLSPGSHNRPVQDLRDRGGQVETENALEMKLPPGAAVLWRTAVWHCVGPNLSNTIRKIMHIGYHYRWLRPTDYMQQDPALIARSSPVRKQLLGAIASGGDPMGEDPDIHPASMYWQTNQDDVPLKTWAEAFTEKS